VLVELWRIELQSKNKLLMASTSLERSFKFDSASYNQQDYTERASGIHPYAETSVRHSYIRVILRALTIQRHQVKQPASFEGLKTYATA